jgi:hypothetical protein
VRNRMSSFRFVSWEVWLFIIFYQLGETMMIMMLDFFMFKYQ